MRCRAGDLAVVIRAHDERNLGKLVRVVEQCQAHPRPGGNPIFMVDGLSYDSEGYTGVVWLVEVLGAPLYSCGQLRRRAPAKDTSLHPIRDGEGTDETLRNLELTQ
jgi:hypothetical protein